MSSLITNTTFQNGGGGRLHSTGVIRVPAANVQPPPLVYLSFCAVVLNPHRAGSDTSTHVSSTNTSENRSARRGRSVKVGAVEETSLIGI